MGALRSIAEINERIRRGHAVVVTAEEVPELVRRHGLREVARRVDVVTTGTFGPMCSSGVLLNIGSSAPRIKLGGGEAYLNDVPAYAGLAAADLYLGATALPDEDPRNQVYPGRFRYGGAQVIEDLVAGRPVRLRAVSYGTDCYPRRELNRVIRLGDLPYAVLLNPRNACQNYNVAVNLSDRPVYTYMGLLLPRLGNAAYSGAGQLSPLINDPLYRTVGIGTRVFLAGGVGYVIWHGTQHCPEVPRGERDVPRRPAGTLAVIGDLKGMSTRWLRAVSIRGYGTSLALGIGVPIPVLDEEVVWHAAVTDEEIRAPVVDYGLEYPQGGSEVLGEVSYAELKGGVIQVRGQEVPTGSISSYRMAREVAEELKRWIQGGRFFLTEPVAPLPGSSEPVQLRR